MANPSADFPVAIHTDIDVSAFTAAKLGSTTPTHTNLEGKQEEEIKAVQTKIGIGASTPTSGKVLKGNGIGTSAWGDLTYSEVGAEPVKGADDNYVTDAEKIVIGNTSGTNTGDNSANSLYSGLAASKQDALISATNIKTVNGASILGAGDLTVAASLTPWTSDVNAAGYSLVGSSASGGNLILLTTSHATKGKILFGTGGAYDSVNTRLGIGTQSPTVELDIVGSGKLAYTLGGNIVTNGTFDADTDWGTHTGWTISGGVATHTTGTTALTQAAATVVIGTPYKITFDIGGTMGTSMTVGCGGISIGTYSATGSFTAYFTAIATTALTFSPTTGFTGTIDNVVLTAVNSGDLAIGDEIQPSVLGMPLRFTNTISAAQGNETAMRFDYTVNKATGGIATGLLVNATLTSSPALGNLIDLQAGGVSQFKMTTGGAVTMVSTLNGVSTINRAADSTLLLQALGQSVANKYAVSILPSSFTQTSGSNGILSLITTYNQATGTAANTDLLINRTQTAVGSGAQLLIDAQVGGTSKFKVSNVGLVTLETTITTPGTTGNQTINKATGRVNIAAAGTTVTVTNSLVTANSIVLAVAATADATARVTNVVPAAGSFIINTVATTAETAFSFIVIN